MLAQRLGRRRRCAAAPADVGDELRDAGAILAHEHGDRTDLVVLGEHGLDLAELDPHAAQLDLVVVAAEELEHAVPGPAREVTGAVHPCPGRSVRVGDEALGGQARPAEVAARELHAGDVQRARDARGDGL